jgi:sugar/nucleoside kinase (ribokinase family)
LPEHVRLLEKHNVDVSGLERQQGQTFRWSGVYGSEDVNTRETLDTQLNVFADFSPTLTEDQRRRPFLFLANIDPVLQSSVLGQMASRPKLVALDSMNFWIEGKTDDLRKAISQVDVIFMDEGEARQFSGQANLVKAARHIQATGPHTVVVKRGEHGVLVFHKDATFVAPAFPLETVVDPTGAGDSFAGGFMGYLASTGDLSEEGFRRAAIFGSVMGSFAVENFSTDRISELTHRDIEERFRQFTHLTRFDALRDGEGLPANHGSS